MIKTIKWADDEDELVRSYILENYDESPLQGALTLREELPTRTVRAIKDRILKLKKDIEPPELELESEPFRFDEVELNDRELAAKGNWEKLTFYAQQKTSEPISTSIGFPATTDVKILSLSDWHIPFERKELIHSIINEHSDADCVVVNGDMLDMYGVSSYSKNQSISALHEYNEALKWITLLASRFSKVYLTLGNHEDRLGRLILKALPVEAHGLFGSDIMARLKRGEVIGGNGQLLDRLDFKNVYYDEETKWFCRIGQTVFTHATNFTNAPGATVFTVHKNLHGQFPYDSIVQGHNHQVSTSIFGGCLLIEQGCLTSLPDYMVSSSKCNYRPQVNGYALIYQDKLGNTDFNKSRAVFAGTQQMPHKLYSGGSSV